MTTEVFNPDRLHNLPAAALPDYLGPLAPYLLRCEEPPSLPERRGIVPVLLVLTEALAEHGELCKGFCLPLQWTTDVADDSAHLPKALRENAKRARLHVSETSSAKIVNEWRLVLCEELKGVDLSKLPIGGTSMWAPLTAGLMLAVGGGTPRRHVFSTGAWHGHGIEAVDGIAEKVGAIRRLVGERNEKKPAFFVPRDNAREAREAAADEVEVLEYEPAVIDLRRVFAKHLKKLDAPPPREAPIEDRLGYVNRPYHGNDDVTEYYLDCLLEDLAARFRRSLLSQVAHKKLKVDRLAMTLGFRCELPIMLIHALKPEETLLVCSRESREKFEKFEERYIPKSSSIEYFEFDSTEAETSVTALVDWLDTEFDQGQGQRIVDVTGGRKSMTAVATLAAVRSDAMLLYVEHDHDEKPKIGTESPCVLLGGD